MTTAQTVPLPGASRPAGVLLPSEPVRERTEDGWRSAAAVVFAFFAVPVILAAAFAGLLTVLVTLAAAFAGLLAVLVILAAFAALHARRGGAAHLSVPEAGSIRFAIIRDYPAHSTDGGRSWPGEASSIIFRTRTFAGDGPAASSQWMDPIEPKMDLALFYLAAGMGRSTSCGKITKHRSATLVAVARSSRRRGARRVPAGPGPGRAVPAACPASSGHGAGNGCSGFPGARSSYPERPGSRPGGP